MRVMTIGYGGRAPTELVRLLQEHGVRTVVDVRIRPDHASMGAYVLARTPDKGIQRLLSDSGIGYTWVANLGNGFRNMVDWRERYERFLRADLKSHLGPLHGIPEPFCLLCAEKDVEKCHRKLVADVLAERGAQVTHL